VDFFFCQIAELNQLTEGAWNGSSGAGGAGGGKDLLCLVAMTHLAGPLFVALRTQDAEPKLLAHQKGEMHVPEEAYGRRVS